MTGREVSSPESAPPAWLGLDAAPGEREATPLKRRVAWAREVCGVGAEATAEETRRALLVGLAKHDFVPDDAWSQASLTLRDFLLGAVETDDPYLCADAIDRGLAQEIDRLAAEFFLLGPGERRVRWERLSRAAANHPLPRQRLAVMQAALDVNPHRLAGDPAAYHRVLARHLCELFALRTAERAVRRGELLRAMEPDWENWRVAAEFLNRHHANLTRLDHKLIRSLIPVSRPRQHVEPAVEPESPPRIVREPVNTRHPTGWLELNWGRLVNFIWIAGIAVVCFAIYIASQWPTLRSPSGNSPVYRPLPQTNPNIRQYREINIQELLDKARRESGTPPQPPFVPSPDPRFPAEGGYVPQRPTTPTLPPPSPQRPPFTTPSPTVPRAPTPGPGFNPTPPGGFPR